MPKGNAMKTIPPNSIKTRTSKIFVQSDLIATRAIVGMSSFLFSAILIFHYIEFYHIHDLFWIIFSMFHAIVTFCALYTTRTSWFSFFGEAICGFILWNYISISILIELNEINFAIGDFSPAMAPAIPTFIAGLSTWWILTRYPKIVKK